jgi:hypothetical protein
MSNEVKVPDPPATALELWIQLLVNYHKELVPGSKLDAKNEQLIESWYQARKATEKQGQNEATK